MLLRSSDGRRAMGRRSIPTRHSDRGSNPEDADDGSMAAYRRRTYGNSGEGTVLDTSFTAFESGSEDTEDETPPSEPHPSTSSFLPHQQATSSEPSLTHFPPPSSSPPFQSSTANQTLRRIPTLPSYIDARPTIKTYFKIYSPSKGGRLLSVYESAPDKFDYSQSWGWKSSTLMLDEGFSNSSSSGGGGGEVPSGRVEMGEGVEGGLAAEVEGQRRVEMERKRRREGGLRFMVVIGNL